MSSIVNNTDRFVVTKALIGAYISNGFTVKQMAEDITAKSGTKCSVEWTRKACKTYGFDLRKKPMPSAFVLEDVNTEGEKLASQNLVVEPSRTEELIEEVVAEEVTNLF